MVASQGQERTAEMVDMDIIASHREQAHTFLARAWEYLEVGDLHQASEKGWGAAAHMSKAVAEAQGWPYRNHEHFLQVVNGAANLLQSQLRPWRKSATDLHSFYYWRKEAMDAEDIRENLAEVEALIGALEGLLG